MKQSWGSRRCRVVDLTVAAVFAALDTAVTLVGGSWWPAHPDGLAWALLVAQGLTCLSLAASRRSPLAVVGGFAAFSLVVTVLITPFGVLRPANPANIWTPFGAVMAVYALVRFAPEDRRTKWTVGAVVLLAIISARPWQPSPGIMTVGVLRIAFGPLLALYFTARKRLVQALRERAERAEREQRLLAEQARAEERARLAGEMHDVVTHRVSLMVLQAGALRVTATDEATRQAAEELRAAGCRALDELRDLVGILRTTPDGDDPPDDVRPSAPGLAELVAESTAAGLPAKLVEDGDPGLASPVVGRTIHRIVREALTNIHKHAPGARATTVHVGYDPAGVRVTVTNTPATGPADAGLIGTGSGVGLVNLRRRIELVRGTLRAGPTSDGGFRVEASLPAYVPTAGPSTAPPEAPAPLAAPAPGS